MKSKCICVSCKSPTRKSFHNNGEIEHFCEMCEIYYHFWIKKGDYVLKSIFYQKVPDVKISFITLFPNHKKTYVYYSNGSVVKLNLDINPEDVKSVYDKIKLYIAFL